MILSSQATLTCLAHPCFWECLGKIGSSLATFDGIGNCFVGETLSNLLLFADEVDQPLMQMQDSILLEAIEGPTTASIGSSRVGILHDRQARNLVSWPRQHCRDSFLIPISLKPF